MPSLDPQPKPPRPQPTPTVRTVTASDHFATPTYRAAIEPYLPEIALDIPATPARSTEIASYTTEMAAYTSEMAVYTTEIAVDASETASYVAEMAVYIAEMPAYVTEISSYATGNAVGQTVYVKNITSWAGMSLSSPPLLAN